MKKSILPLLVALFCLPGLQVIAVAQKASLKFTIPAGWIEEERTSSMRVAQYRLAKANGDAEDASVVLYYFGQGQGGSTAANIERWVSQIKQADGGSSKETAKEETFDVNGLKVTTVDVAGTYVAETAPGSGSFLNKPGFRLRGAVVETPQGSYFVKLVGPEKTVTQWNESFLSYIRSFQLK